MESCKNTDFLVKCLFIYQSSEDYFYSKRKQISQKKDQWLIEHFFSNKTSRLTDSQPNSTEYNSIHLTALQGEGDEGVGEVEGVSGGSTGI